MLTLLGLLSPNPGFFLCLVDIGSCGCQRWLIHTASLSFPTKGLPLSTSEIARSAVIGLAVTHLAKHGSLNVMYLCHSSPTFVSEYADHILYLRSAQKNWPDTNNIGGVMTGSSQIWVHGGHFCQTGQEGS